MAYQNFDYFGLVGEILQIYILQYLLHYVSFYLLEVTAAVFYPNVNLLQQCENSHVESFLAQTFRNVTLTWDVETIYTYSTNRAQHFY